MTKEIKWKSVSYENWASAFLYFFNRCIMFYYFIFNSNDM